MNRTWASGCIELLQHANTHIDLENAFDKRIAFISIDNAVEVMVKTYLSLPKHFFGSDRPSRKELDDCSNSFTNYLILLTKYAGNKLVGIEMGDIEHYHRIRNTLYHDGTGLAVDQQYLNAYFALAKLLLKRLFDINTDNTADEFSLGKLIANWNLIEEYLTEILDPGLIYTGLYDWDDAVLSGIISQELVDEIMHLKALRNLAVHSKKIDNSHLDLTYQKSVDILERIKTQVEKSRKTLKDRNFFYEPIVSEIKGKLIIDTFFGPPGYGETPDIDQVENTWILELENPINVIQDDNSPEEGKFNYSKFNVERVQLATFGSGIDMHLFKNKEVSITGTFWGAHTGHHITPVLMTVKQIVERKG